jgi:signal transduction histidine kinase/ligand-binding sensor domain-containing protein/CheY-like chemotaxis protein
MYNESGGIATVTRLHSPAPVARPASIARAIGGRRVRALSALAVLLLLAACVGGSPATQTPALALLTPAQPVLSAGHNPLTPRPRRDNDIRFTNLSLDQGLSQSVVTAMWQDRQGFLWLGTQDGLNRYDGYAFKVFKHDPADLGSLSDNYVYAIVEDAQGILWLGTNGGLNRFDPTTERFDHFQHDPQNPESLSSNVVVDLLLDREGALWAGTGADGLNRLEGGRLVRYRNDPDDPSSLSSDAISALFQDSDGTVWVGTTGGGLNRWDRATGRFTRYCRDPQDPGSLPDDTVNAIAQDVHGDLWLATTGGLAQIDRRSGRFTSYQVDSHDPHSLSDNVVFSVFVDRNGTLWAGTSSGGLNRMEEDGHFVHYQPVAGDPTTLPSASVYSIFQDAGAVLWFGTFGGGVSKYSWTSEKLPLVRAVPGDSKGLSDNGVWTFFEDSQGTLWVGTVAGGLNQLDPATGEFVHYLNDPGDPKSLSSNFVMSVYEDRQGHLWVGTLAGGLNRLDRETGSFARYPTPPNVSSFVEDRSGTLWIATSVGLGRYDPTSETFQYLLHDPDDPGSVSDSNLTTLYQDREGRIWVGTFSAGLNLFDPVSQTFTRYRHDPQDPSSLSGDVVLSIVQDSEGTLWVGTTAGLDRLDAATGTFAHYRERDGLPNEVIYCVIGDDSGRLWLSTNRGLSRFDPVGKTFRNYSPADGLQSNEFNQSACYRDSLGRFYFGGINGFNLFRPDEVIDNQHIPPVVVTNLLLFNASVVPGADSPLKEAASIADELQLTYKQDNLTFEFSALDYAAPERNRYAYLMEGLDEGWNEVGTRRFAGYTHIPPGDYVFRVRGANSDGVWNTASASMRISIAPPFWQTWWFRGLMIAVGVAVVAGGFTVRLRIVERQKEHLELLVSERTQALSDAMVELRCSRDAAQSANRAKSVFLANISHELRTPLNAILGFSQLMLSSPALRKGDGPSLTPAQRENLEIISRSGEHLLGLINDVLEMSKIEAGRITLSERSFDLQQLLEDLEDMFRLRAEEKGIALEVELAPDVPRYVCSDEGKLRQILMNLLSNGCKFTQTGGVAVGVGVRSLARAEGSDGRVLHVEVQDTGVGIAPEEQASIFEPFVQSQSGRQSQEGTGLGLSISRQYAQLMGGDLTVQSQPGQGSTFVLEVPLQAVDPATVREGHLVRRAVGLEPGQPYYRILAVDDKEVNRQLLVRLLAPLGFDVREAANGQEALEVWEAWDPHLILMDMRMPVMDGYEATRRIKATLKGHATAIIALTASALEEDRSVILSEGCDGYMRKPFRDHELFAALEKHLGVRFVYEEVAEGGTVPFMRGEGQAVPGHATPADMQERLAALPSACVDQLRQATRLGALEPIRSAIAQIREQDAVLADALDAWAEDFEHDKILAVLGGVGPSPKDATTG